MLSVYLFLVQMLVCYNWSKVIGKGAPVSQFKKLLMEDKIDKNDRLAKWIEFIANEDESQWEVIA